jgi:hypothetical protein
MTNVQQFDSSTNILPALIWEYDSSPALASLVTNKQAWITANQQRFWEDWYTDVFNLLTANDFGLSVWSIILGIPLYIPADPDPPDAPIFGFNFFTTGTTLENNYTNFSYGNFSSINDVTFLSTEEQRLILRMKYYQITSNASITNVNAYLNELFSNPALPFSGTVWLLDGLDMSITVVFSASIPSNVIQVIEDLDLIPRSAGVLINYVEFNPTPFGFNEIPSINDNQNFDNGTLTGE